MNDRETRSLGRAVILLVIVSGVRWGWQNRPAPEPPPGPDAAAELLEGSRTRARQEEHRSRPLGPDERLDPNRASAVELDRLPGVGPSTAQAMVEFRDSMGGFRRPEDLVGVPGIGAVTAARLGSHLEFDAPPPSGRLRERRERDEARISLNRADEDALQLLPGVGPALARRIVETRAVRPFRVVEDLLEVQGIGPATLARIRDRVTVGR